MDVECENVEEIVFERVDRDSIELLCANEATPIHITPAPEETAKILDIEHLGMEQRPDDIISHDSCTNQGSNDVDVQEIDVGLKTNYIALQKTCINQDSTALDSHVLANGQKTNAMLPHESCVNQGLNYMDAKTMDIRQTSHLNKQHMCITSKPDSQEPQDSGISLRQTSTDTQEPSLHMDRCETVMNQSPQIMILQESNTEPMSDNSCINEPSMKLIPDNGIQDLNIQHSPKNIGLVESKTIHNLHNTQNPSREEILDNTGTHNLCTVLNKYHMDSHVIQSYDEQGKCQRLDIENQNMGIKQSIDHVELSSHLGTKCTLKKSPNIEGAPNIGIQQNLEDINAQDVSVSSSGPTNSDLKLIPDNTVTVAPEGSIHNAVTETMAHTQMDSCQPVSCSVPGVCSVCHSLFTQNTGAVLLHSDSTSSINPQLIQGCIMTSSEGKNQEITQYLILQDSDDPPPNYQLTLSPVAPGEMSPSHGSCGPEGVSDMEALEGMMEVVIVQQYKCKMCQYKSVSKTTLLRHVRERHVKRGKNEQKDKDRKPEQTQEEEEEEDDDIVDAGAIDDPDGDSDYSPGEETSRNYQFESSNGTLARERPRRRPGRPRKIQRTQGPEVDTTMPTVTDNQDEVATSTPASENNGPTSNNHEEQKLPNRTRGYIPKNFRGRKYRRYRSRRYYKPPNKQLLRPFLCRVCGSRFLTLEDFTFHVSSHDGNDPQTYRCLQCSYQCRRWSSLKEHMFNHKGNKPHKCEHCDYTSVYKKDVIRHAEIHKREQKKKTEMPVKESSYPCPVCNRVYNMQKRLTQHLKTHSAEKPHMCDKCGKAFKKRYTFKMHLLTHLQSVDSTRYKCEFCEYMCEDRKQLLNHQLTHMNDKPFKCTQCKYHTYRQDFLLSHQATRHAGGKPFACDYCHFHTKHKKNLRLHVKCRHVNLFQEWVQRHPEETPSRQRPFFSIQQIEKLKQQHDQLENPAQQAPEVENSQTQLAMLHQPTQQAGEEQSQNSLETAAIIYDQGEEELTTRAALDLLLNMSAQRDASGDGLQVAVVKSGTCGDGQGSEASDGAQEPPMTQVLTLHMDEREVSEVHQAGFEETGVQQITINTAFTAAEYSLINAENIQSSLCSDADIPNDSPQTLLGENLKDKRALQVLRKPRQVQLASGNSPPPPAAKKFSCKFCSSSFWGRAEMESHKRAHVEGSNGFKCHDCNFIAPSWPEVRDHMTLHADLRPHRCNQCSFASRNKKDLSRHAMTHTNHRPHFCHLCGQRFNRKGHLKFHIQRLHNGGSVPQPENEELTSGPPLEEEHVFLTQGETISNQENTAYIQEITTADGQTLQQLVTADNQVQYIISQEGVPHLLPQEYVVLPEGHHIQVQDGQITHIQYEPGTQFLQDPQIHFVPMSPTHQLLTQEQLEAAAHSAVTAVADAAMAQTVYTTERETALQHEIEYDVITLTD
ncbi:zinc finger 335 [Pelobates cultripes]|uniref:Zinc finger 335 n=1 Tax=Pelobates cultripes TaxID=61616 RepID=A0AAD1SIZ1_PELCU|nr:zinc finger 335 [Pelobates cultripes]